MQIDLCSLIRYGTRRVPTLLAAAVAIVLLSSSVPEARAQDGEEPAGPPVDAVELFNKGQDAHEKGQLTEAIGLYEKAIAAVVEFPEAEFQRANALLSLGRKDEAEKGFRRAVQIRPDWTLALANLGSILVGKASYVEAETLLQKAVKLDDQNSLALSALTELKLARKAGPDELRELLARLTVLTGKANPTASAWAARGAIEAALGDKRTARTSFDRALQLEPANQFALISMAGVLLDEGDISAADAAVRRLEAAKPDAAPLKPLKARILFANGKADEAVALLMTIPDPPAEVVELRERMLLSKTEDPAVLEKQLEKNTGDAFILGRLCSAYRTAAPVKALDYCRRASEADPNNLSYAVGFAAALVQAKSYPEAVELLKRLQAVSPENVTIRANLATALFQMKRYPEAKDEYQWITEKQPTSPAAYYFLGITHDQLTEYMDAMANYQLFLKYADPERNRAEIEKVNLRLPVLQKQIKQKKGKRG